MPAGGFDGLSNITRVNPRAKLASREPWRMNRGRLSEEPSLIPRTHWPAFPVLR